MEAWTALLTIVSLAVSSVTHLDVSNLACDAGKGGVTGAGRGSVLDRSSLAYKTFNQRAGHASGPGSEADLGPLDWT